MGGDGGDGLGELLCCCFTAQSVAEVAAYNANPGAVTPREQNQARKAQISTPVFGGELPMLALAMDRSTPEVVVVEDKNMARVPHA